MIGLCPSPSHCFGAAQIQKSLALGVPILMHLLYQIALALARAFSSWRMAEPRVVVALSLVTEQC